MNDKNYADASERALLRVPDREAEQYMTLQEAKVAWTTCLTTSKRGRQSRC
jgi:hypothetical protein